MAEVDYRPNRSSVVTDVCEILNDRTADPAEEIVRHGEALVAIGNALRGLSATDARAVMQAASVLTLGAA